MTRPFWLAVATLTFAGLITQAAPQPLKIFILAGQSNMQGMARPQTLPHMAADPATKALHDKIVEADGKPRVYDQVRVAAFSEEPAWGNPDPKQVTKTGPLTIGFGGPLSDDRFGPELAFGITAHEMLQEPILIIKTAWGGKSLLKDFRPPSAGTYDSIFNAEQKAAQAENEANWLERVGPKHVEKFNVTMAELKRLRATAESRYYKLMVENVNKVLADPGSYHPAYDPKAGYEIAGFVWFQGFNDLVSGRDYEPWGGHKAYADLMAHLIRDVRSAFKAPKLPVVIGVLGVDGKVEKMPADKQERQKIFRDAMAAPATMPEFKGTVAAVRTANYWPEDVAAADKKANAIKQQVKTEARAKQKAEPDLDKRAFNQWQRERTDAALKVGLTADELHLLETGKANGGYHYLGSAKCYSQIGEAFAKALFSLK